MPPRRPPHVVCYICGRLYGTTSISLHIPKCLEKWEMENSQLPRHLRRKPPQAPTGWGNTSLSSDPRVREAQLDSMNEMAFQASQNQLIPCENCGRTFNPDRLPVHQRSCKPNNPLKMSKNFDPSRLGSGRQGSPREADYGRRSPQPPRKPKTVVCFICGREFGTKSIGIHEPQCLKKWELENSRMPKHLRRPPPVKPSILPSLSGDGGDGLGRRNQLAYESSQKQLVPCRNCGRTFLPERLEIHIRSCKPGSKTMPLRQSGGELCHLILHVYQILNHRWNQLQCTMAMTLKYCKKRNNSKLENLGNSVQINLNSKIKALEKKLVNNALKCLKTE